MPADLAQDDWNRFLDGYGWLFVLVLCATVFVTLLGYRFSARRLRIQTVADVFRPYSPLLWLFTALAGGVVAAAVCAVQYGKVLPGAPGLASTSAEMFLLLCGAAALISYVLIAFVPPPLLTPYKYRYRPAPFLHRKSISR